VEALRTPDAIERQSGIPRGVFPVITVLMVLFGLGLGFRSRIILEWKRWRSKRYEREKAYFNRFRKLSLTGHPEETLRALMHWMDRIHSGSGAARLDRFLQEFGDEGARLEANRLFSSLGSPEESGWNGRALADCVTAARKRWKGAERKRETIFHALPPLNPVRIDR
jgi:hypothetical protein